MGVLGISSTEKLGWFAAHGTPNLAHQGQGAMIVLVLFGLWIGREHLRDVLRKAFKGEHLIDDSGEMLSYRVAVFSWLGGMGVITVWMSQSGFLLWAVF